MATLFARTMATRIMISKRKKYSKQASIYLNSTIETLDLHRFDVFLVDFELFLDLF